MAVANSKTPRFAAMPVLTPGGFAKLSWTEWGPPDAQHVVLCVHGLTRNSRDFDFLATALAEQGWRVVCPDMLGRGRSDYLSRAEDYAYPVYAAAMAALIGRTGAVQVDWVGTSMGGIIGMDLAARPATPIRRMVLNDVGPFIPKASLERISRYMASPDLRFDDLAAVEAAFRRMHAPFGALTDPQWRHMAEHGAVATPEGKYRLHYDPAIGSAFGKGPIEDVTFWPAYETIAIPMLVIRGAQSDLLLRETAEEMTRRGAAAQKGRVTLREIAGAGHAPALMANDQIALVRAFLAAS